MGLDGSENPHYCMLPVFPAQGKTQERQGVWGNAKRPLVTTIAGEFFAFVSDAFRL